MNAEQIAEGKRLLDVVVETHEACKRDSTEATREEAYMARVDRDIFLRNHARELLTAAEQRETILALARKYAHPGVNPGAHELASEILRIVGERVMKTIVVMIGNSDNKLTQNEWAHFAAHTHQIISSHVHEMHFRGGSDWNAPWQNACWVGSIDEANIAALRQSLAIEASNARQESVAALIGDTEFIPAR